MCNESRLLTPKCIIKETDENIIHEVKVLYSKYFIQSTSFKVLNLYNKDKSCHLKNNSRYLRNDPGNIFTELKKVSDLIFPTGHREFFYSKEKSHFFVRSYLMNSMICFVD